MTGIYVHIPFCIKKCNYCSFNSFDNILSLQDEYVKRVIEEIRTYPCEEVDSVYFGGGTPSLLKTDNLLKIFDVIQNHFNVSASSEITIEVNPKTADKGKFSVLRKCGFNRISMGFQSFIDSELSCLGRVHSADDNKKAFYDAREAGFENISADIMFALPSQSIKDFEKSVNEMLSLSPEHFSAYSLSIDQGTHFYKIRETLNLPDEDEERRMYHFLCEKLFCAGYEHYEISNFAKAGFRAKHNTKYWLQEPYIGIGAGAHSYYGDKRYSNICDINKYIKSNTPKEFEEYISADERKRERYMLRLRMMDGIEKEESEKIQKLVSEGLLEEVGGRIRLTKRGIDISNYVFSELI